MVSISLSAVITFVEDLSKPYIMFIIVLHVVTFLLITIIAWRQPQNISINTFKVCLSIKIDLDFKNCLN
jgi:hypothetical protein